MHSNTLELRLQMPIRRIAYCRSDRLMDHHIRANTTSSIVRAYINDIQGWVYKCIDALYKGDVTCKLAGTLTIRANVSEIKWKPLFDHQVCRVLLLYDAE